MRRLVDEASLPCSRSELDIFGLPPTNIAIEREWNEEIPVVNSINDQGPWEFRIPADPHFIDLRHNYLHMALKIVDKDGKDLPALEEGADPTVGPVDLLPMSLIRNVRVYLNSQLVWEGNGLYPFKCFLEMYLNHGADARNSYAKIMGMMPDEDNTANLIENEGFITRAKPFYGGKTVEFIAPVFCDLFTQEKFLLPNIDLRMELTRSSDAFCLLSSTADSKYRLKIESMKWVVRKVQIVSSYQLALEEALKTRYSNYALRRTFLTSLHIDEGRMTAPLSSLLTAQIPRRILVALIDAQAYHGHFTKTPFKFANFNIKEAYVTAAGQKYPNYPLRADWKQGRFSEMYYNLFDAIGMTGDNRGNLITPEKFEKSFCVLAFDLTPCANDSNQFELISTGTTSLHLEFSEPVPKPGIQALCYFEFDNCIHIDQNRVCKFDYSY